MNRYMSAPGSSALDGAHQGEVMHRYILGLYRVLETITHRFPNILFENCTSGGGRFDAGMLYYMPQTWTSDDSDAVERLKIQYGTSIVYPFSAMGAHVSAVPNHQIGRITSFEMRCNVALPGQFGFELDLNKCTDDELKTAERAIKVYRELGEVFHKGDCYRLKSPFDSDVCAIEFISEDKNTVILTVNSSKATAYAPDAYILLEGLDENALYTLDGTDKCFGGDYLMRFERDVVSLNPQWVSICIGINDVWRQFDSPAMPDIAVFPDEYRENVEKMILAVKDKVKGICILSPYYMESNREDMMRKRMDEYVSICRELAEKHKCLFVDFQAMYERFCRIRHSSCIAWDRVHPNQIGATLMAKEYLSKCGFNYSNDLFYQ